MLNVFEIKQQGRWNDWLVVGDITHKNTLSLSMIVCVSLLTISVGRGSHNQSSTKIATPQCELLDFCGY